MQLARRRVMGASVSLLLSLPVVIVLASTIHIRAQSATCVIVGRAVNINRKVLAPVNGVHIAVECPGFTLHTAPWGNWGASSNVGTKQDGDQFQGWKCGDKCQWNSCTSSYPPPSCTYYNDVSCTKQKTTKGTNDHGGFAVRQYVVGCPRFYRDGTVIGGCQQVPAGTAATLSQNFMTLYELDWPDADDLVQSMYFPNLTAALGSCDPWSCTAGTSAWAAPTSYDTPTWPPLVDARMAISIRGVLMTTYPYGDCDKWICPECVPGQPCPPCKMAPPDGGGELPP